MEIHSNVDLMIAATIRKIKKAHSARKKDIEKSIEAYLATKEQADKKLYNQFKNGLLDEREFKNKRLMNIIGGREYTKFLETVAEDITDIAEECTDIINRSIEEIGNYSYKTEAEKQRKDYSDYAGIVAALAVVPVIWKAHKCNRPLNVRYTRQGLHSFIVGFSLQPDKFESIKAQLVKQGTARTLKRNIRWIKNNFITYANYAENKGRQCCYDVLSNFGIDREKVWHTQKDERVRADHATANGQTVPINKPFIIGGYEMMFPGDNSGGAPPNEYYNCRCYMKLKQ